MASSFLTNEIKNRAQSILSTMTLAQKIGQMTQVERSTCEFDDVQKYHIGSVLSGAGSSPSDNSQRAWLTMIDQYWLASTFKDHQYSGIPILYGADAIHGHGNLKNATIFPHQIGLGAAGSDELVYQISRATALELKATGINWIFGPNLAVAKNPRWGRTYESFSDQTSQVTALTKSLVTGYQGSQLGEGVVACAKHYVGDGGTLFGIDQGDTRLSNDALYEQHIAPFVEAVNANVLTIMASFSSYNGVKCHANHELLTTMLKQKFGFDGFILSDMEGIDFLSGDFYQAVAQGVNAGIDMFMMPKNWSLFIEYMHHHVEFGSISMSRIDDAVFRILSVKLAAGLFEAPLPSQHSTTQLDVIGCPEHRTLARKAVQKSLVLLKNDLAILPLSPTSRILVTGKNAHNIGHQCGGFTVDWQGFSGNDKLIGATSIWQGIQLHSPHAHICLEEVATAADPNVYDVAIVVIGETPYAEGLGDIQDNKQSVVDCVANIDGQFNVIEPYGGSISLNELHPEDLSLINTLRTKGMKVVTVLISGRPLIIDTEIELSDAFVAAWLPGSEGQGVADVLFGHHPFVGQLNFDWPTNSSTPIQTLSV
jgi:beta-glucosidase